MLKDAKATPMIAVSDIGRAQSFYADTLGLPTSPAMGGEMLDVDGGGTPITVYRSDEAGTNKATAITFAVDDIGGTVAALKEKGVGFEHYDVEGLERDGDIYVGTGMKTAWFKDPDGNILSLFEGDGA
ncbi:VOC family protein [Sphingomonas sabuli]|uniref:VOC family protein n=1 Tax=Sphingomonas sabuli TaxID=2764186 RepID=A0A7G9L1S7_9SPHN|nr:VOC family protein [Sphingomonas sabuli]QNM82576.1 VOC family protein [Sphingomonas sabuli]